MGSGRHAQHNSKQSGRGSGISPILLVLVLVVAVAGVGWAVFRPKGSGAANADDCGRVSPVVVSVVPAMQLAMERALSEITAEDPCFPAEVRVEAPSVVEDSFFNGGRPDLWVADTAARVERLKSIGVTMSAVSPSLAVTPVGLVGGPVAEAPESWIRAFESGRVVLGDPATDSASAMALVAPILEGEKTGAVGPRTESAVVSAAQSYGVRATEGTAEPVGLEEISATFTQLVPVTEQEMLTKGANATSMKILTPATGAPRLTFPLLRSSSVSRDADKVAAALMAWFGGDEGAAALAESGLRGPDAAPLEGRGVGDAALFPDVTAPEFDKVLGAWKVLSVPSSLLAVFDVSGSMDFDAGGGQTRVDLAVGAALTALDVFPRHARVGMWAFSIEQGGPRQDWRELAPLRRLNETTGGRPHYAHLKARIPVLRRLTQGGTGLYDTTLAAYQKAVRAYDKNYFNAVVLLSDGANDDPGSTSLPDLLKMLDQVQDPDRPVRIISVGISSDADMPALQAISKATGGSAYQAEDPRDILSVFAKALMAR